MQLSCTFAYFLSSTPKLTFASFSLMDYIIAVLLQTMNVTCVVLCYEVIERDSTWWRELKLGLIFVSFCY